MTKTDRRVKDVAELPAALTVDEFADAAGLGRHAVYSAIKRGEIHAVKVGRRLLVPKASLQRLIELPQG